MFSLTSKCRQSVKTSRALLRRATEAAVPRQPKLVVEPASEPTAS